jgi:hypothetical protein
MSQLPELGAPAASCVARSATDRCRKAALPNVIGAASPAVGPAELVSGVKSEKRMPLAPATSVKATPPPRSRPATMTAIARLRRGFLM